MRVGRSAGKLEAIGKEKLGGRLPGERLRAFQEKKTETGAQCAPPRIQECVQKMRNHADLRGFTFGRCQTGGGYDIIKHKGTEERCSEQCQQLMHIIALGNGFCHACRTVSHGNRTKTEPL